MSNYTHLLLYVDDKKLGALTIKQLFWADISYVKAPRLQTDTSKVSNLVVQKFFSKEIINEYCGLLTSIN